MQFLVRTGKARSSSRPCKAGRSERPQPVKTRLLARDRKFFPLFLGKKIPDPLLTGEDAEICSAARRGAALLKQKTSARRAVRFSFSTYARDNYRKAIGILNYRVVPQSDRARTPQSDRGLRPKVIVDKCLMHRVFGDKCGNPVSRRLAPGDSLCTLDHRKGRRMLNDQRKDRETEDGADVSHARAMRAAAAEDADDHQGSAD